MSPVDVPHLPRGRASSRVEQEASANLVRYVTSTGEQSCRHQESTVVKLLPEQTEVGYMNNLFFLIHSLLLCSLNHYFHYYYIYIY